MPHASSPDDALDSRGYFWPSTEVVPVGRIGPASAVSGRLRIRADGVSELDLDGIMPTADLNRRIIVPGPVEGSVAGVLTEGGRNVLLENVSGNGARIGGGPSHEQLVANRCLVADTRSVEVSRTNFRSVELPLDGFEDWLGRGRITALDRKRSVTASYSKPSVARWKLEKMNVELARYLAGNAGDYLPSIAWREHAVLRIKPRTSRITVDQAVDLAERTEDLLVLLADCNRAVDFPRLRMKPDEPGVRLYFARSSRSKDERAKWNKAWVSFEACKDQFGDILETWLEKHEIYGPGFHLYLGNRRGHPMYWEHRFASLIWGLESLHRSLVPTKENRAQAAKVIRIVEQIAKSSDRKWAERHLPKQSEPTLATRIFDLILMLPLGFHQAELIGFAERCAARRNDVSHFGGVRRPGDYNDFIQDIVKLSGAIDVFYHALLLQIAGVPGDRIAWYFLHGLNAPFVQGKLLDCDLTVMAKK